MNQDLVQDAAKGGGEGGSTGFATGTICTSSGTYRASNKYMENIVVMEEGEAFHPFSDGKKTTWYPLTPNTGSKAGSFESVRVAPGTI